MSLFVIDDSIFPLLLFKNIKEKVKYSSNKKVPENNDKEHEDNHADENNWFR